MRKQSLAIKWAIYTNDVITVLPQANALKNEKKEEDEEQEKPTKEQQTPELFT